jgi:hypothetical protein
MFRGPRFEKHWVTSRWLLNRHSYAGLIMYSRAGRVFILKRFTPECFAVGRGAFGSAFHEKQLPRKKSLHRLVTTVQDTGSICAWTVLMRVTAWNDGRAGADNRLQQRHMAARFQNCHRFGRFVREGVHKWYCVLNGTLCIVNLTNDLLLFISCFIPCEWNRSRCGW